MGYLLVLLIGLIGLIGSILCLLLSKKNDYMIIDGCLYKDKILFNDCISLKKADFKIHYDFKDGKICAISAYNNDKSGLYSFAPSWNVACFGNNGIKMDIRAFEILYKLKTDPEELISLLIKTYPELEGVDTSLHR